MKNVMMLKLSEMKEDFNPRTDFSSVEELAKSIESVGLLQPIVVQKNGEDYKIVDGACRFRALKKLEQKETQVIVIDTKSADEAQMAANLMRADLNLLERARGYARLIQALPAKWNVNGIVKTFGEKKATVERLISVAKRIPAKYDVKVGQLEFEQMEILAQVPAGIIDKVIDVVNVKDHRAAWQALSRVCKDLDYSCDALTTGKLVSAGRAFVIKANGDHAYTADLAAYKEAKDAYEKKHSQQYGQQDKDNKAKVVEKSEKQKAADRAARKKEKDARMAAIKELPGLFKKFIGSSVDAHELHAAAKELFEHHVDSDKCRRIWAAFGVKGCDKVSSYELRGKTYDTVIRPYITTTQSIAKLLSFVKMGWKDGATPEQAWVAGMKK